MAAVSWPRLALMTALLYGAEMIVGPSLTHCLTIGGAVIGAILIDRF